MSKPVKSIESLVIDGTKHFTRADLTKRIKADAKMKFGSHDFKMPSEVRKSKYARDRWNELTAMYTRNEIDLVQDTDAKILERYCLTYAEYRGLIDAENEVAELDASAFTRFMRRNASGLERAINQKIAVINTLEDRLFLNPIARLKAIPHLTKVKDAAPPAPPAADAEMFGG